MKKFAVHPIFAKAKEDRKGGFVPHPVFKHGTYKFNTKMTIDPLYDFRF